MNKHQSLFMTVVVIFCIVLAGGGCFYLGTKMTDKKPETVKTDEKEDESKDKENDTFKEFTVVSYPTAVNNILYNYLKSDNKNLDDYLNSISNNHKLYLAGILGYDGIENDLENKKLEDLKKNLNKYFGSDFGLKGENYFISEDDEVCLFKYNENDKAFVYNEDTIPTDVLVDLDRTEIYNYKLDTIDYKDDSVVLTYYGLYAVTDTVGPTTVTNNKNIKRVLNYDQETDNLTDAEYLSDAFTKNKNDLFKFTYTYKLIDEKYVLVDFQQA